ncbi:glycosyl hydrolase family 28-related protein [Porcipelethomonas sp.]|uniref:glycosyl hydrolase family 28-related protein n=1 Tax=Porcipelethomonas sp. TaxID=2981675 RepID=UPI003EF5969B
MKLKNKILAVFTAGVMAAAISSADLYAYTSFKVFAAESTDLADEQVSVIDFGAVPDDSQDDATAINSALHCAKEDSQSSICEVYIPEGKYYINSTLFIYSNTRLILDKNAVIVSSSDGPMLCPLDENNKADGTGEYGLVHDIYISGGTWDANGNSGQKTLSKAIMVFRNSTNITVSDTTLTHCYGNHFIICDGIDGLNITNVSFKDFVSYTGDISQYDFLKNISDSGKQKSAIGAIEALHIDFASDSTPCKNVKVTSCTFSNVPSGVGTHHTNTDYACNIDIHNNRFKDVWFTCVRAGSFQSLKVYNNTAERAAVLFRSEDSQAEVYNNTFTGLSSVPESRYDTSSTIHTVLIQENSSVNFHDNIIKSSNGVAASYINNGSKNNIFTGNTIDGSSMDGMFIEKSTVSVTYNTIKKCSRSGVRAMGATVTCINNNIVSCSEKFADFFSGCTASSCKDNGITSGAKSYFGSDCTVSVSNNLPSISEMTVSIPKTSYIYTGSAIKPAVTVKNGTTSLSSNDYKVSYKNNTNIGTATILVEGKGSYRGFVKKTFIIEEEIKPVADTGVKGDANGDGTLNVRDAAYIAKLLARGAAEFLPPSADYNGDEKINVRDAAAIAKMLSSGT